MRWPLALAAGLGLVVAVNLFVAYLAVKGADPVDPSYAAEAR
jgi:hypothetical protein